MESSEIQPPSWADMLPETLAKIFGKLSLEEMLTVIPRVCKSWGRVSRDAVCWQVVDLDEWSRFRSTKVIERLIKMLVNRSHGIFRKFSMSSLRSDEIFQFIAWSGHYLQVLHIPYSSVTDDCVSKVAASLPSITDLDISGCAAMSSLALRAFGEHSRSITRLNRNMYPRTLRMISPNDDEAFAISQYMPKLEHLEMADGLLTNTGLRAILEMCPSLHHLYLRGCWNLEMEALIEECKKRFTVFVDPGGRNYNPDDPNLYKSPPYDNFFSILALYCEADDLRSDMHEEERGGPLSFLTDKSARP